MIWLRFQQLYEAKYSKILSFKEEPFPEGSEPFGLKPFDFHANRLSRLVRKAVEEEKISISRAAEILNLSSEQMMERITEWEEYGKLLGTILNRKLYRILCMQYIVIGGCHENNNLYRCAEQSQATD